MQDFILALRRLYQFPWKQNNSH